jgi:hypothetical protein
MFCRLRITLTRYIRGKKNLKGIFVYPGFYASNLNMFANVKDGVLQIPLAVPSDTKLPVYDTNDGGEVVYRLLQDPEKWVGKNIHLTGGYITPSEMASTYTKGTSYISSILCSISYW